MKVEEVLKAEFFSLDKNTMNCSNSKKLFPKIFIANSLLYQTLSLLVERMDSYFASILRSILTYF